MQRGYRASIRARQCRRAQTPITASKCNQFQRSSQQNFTHYSVPSQASINPKAQRQSQLSSAPSAHACRQNRRLHPRAPPLLASAPPRKWSQSGESSFRGTIAPSPLSGPTSIIKSVLEKVLSGLVRLFLGRPGGFGWFARASAAVQLRSSVSGLRR